MFVPTCVCARVGNFPFELKQRLEGKKTPASKFHPTGHWQWAGCMGLGFDSSCVSHTSRTLAGECNVSFILYTIIIIVIVIIFIKYLVGNFTLALTELAEAA